MADELLIHPFYNFTILIGSKRRNGMVEFCMLLLVICEGVCGIYGTEEKFHYSGHWQDIKTWIQIPQVRHGGQLLQDGL